ncbi:MAG: 50S ribosomal protein L11 methyltransferase [Alphaproteobacteria bacterium]
MYRVHATMPRADAERISEILAGLDPSPAAAVAIEEVSRTLWQLEAFCHDEDRARSAASLIETELTGASAAVEMLADRDWVAQSLAGLPAVHAGPFVVAGAHELGGVGGGKIPVWIEAGPAFGTGHHGTTKGCLLALADIARWRRLGKVLDIGTGSGVLAIAALKLGATSAIAGDIDADSIRIAKENATNNKSGRALKLLCAVGTKSRLVQESGPYDLVLANILARPLVGLSAEIAKLVRPGGHVILSGLLTHQEPQVRGAYSGRGLNLVARRRITGWSTLVYRRPAS